MKFDENPIKEEIKEGVKFNVGEEENIEEKRLKWHIVKKSTTGEEEEKKEIKMTERRV